MEDTRPVKQVRIAGRKRRGRPHKTWDKNAAAILERKGCTCAEVKIKVKFRKDIPTRTYL